MRKIANWIYDNVLYLATLFLLAFIPLYPKIPLVDVKNTWVYIRLEDLFVVLTVLVWVYFILRKKVTLKTPVTIPIMVFWIIGSIATIHGVILIFPNDANVFPNVAFLAFLRHIEYLSLFFVAFAAMLNKKYLGPVITVLAATLLGVTLYGFGQKYAGLPAFLTMNEEFAKGVPIRLSQMSRLPSTFAGQYDLAAYLVLIVPIMVSIIIGARNWIVKIVLAGISVLAFGLLFMTVSRVSFFVLLVALFLLLFFYKKKFVLFALPIAAVAAFALITFSPALLARFGNTVKQVDVLVNGKTGAAVGEVRFVPIEYFRGKDIRQERINSEDELTAAITGEDTPNTASVSGLLDYSKLSSAVREAPLVTAANVSNGEYLPQGTGYINLSLSPVTRRVGNFFYEMPPDNPATVASVLILHGDFIVKRASAYDLSFTTRFQGEWPHAILAFERNILIGSGYGSVSLAVDNNYLRMLAETGLLGTLAFFAIFIGVAIYIRKVLPDIDSPLAKSFVLGYAAGVIGLALNATLIDVFEASKIAYLLWLLTGITLGILVLYQKKSVKLVNEYLAFATSVPAIIIYVAALCAVIYAPMLGNYFVGDDFTWFRWAADCGASVCAPIPTIWNYFTNSAGFFYRPGTKTFIYLMYQFFWLNQVMYHIASIVLDAISISLFFVLAKRVFKNTLYAAGAAFIFLIMSGYSEAVYWMSSIGFLFTSMFMLAGLLLFIYSREKNNIVLYVMSLISLGAALLFQEFAVVGPLILITYSLIFERINIRDIYKKSAYIFLFLPDIVYLLIRFVSESHWQGGDYSYNLVKAPFNIVGNIFGYVVLSIFGPIVLPIYEKARDIMKVNIPIAIVVVIVVLAAAYFIYKFVSKKVRVEERRIIYFGVALFVISLMPFLPLGNITSRYAYFASFGTAILLVYAAQKVYTWIFENNTRAIASAALVVVISSYVLLQVIQLQQTFLDWRGAGQRAENFLVAIADSYADYWSNTPLQFHFVNVPTRVGEAWVFPVGIEDALWFAFKNPNVSVTKETQVTPELQSQISRTFKVFEFNDDGTVVEIQPPKSVSATPTPTGTLRSK